MAKVFLSYRRADPLPEWSVKRIESMCLDSGFDEVFLDRSPGAIPVASDYDKEIEKAIRASDVVLVLIGEKWQSLLDARGDDPTDMVQLEIGLALELDKKVVPILLGGPMPKVEELPERLKPFHFKNGGSFESDTVDSLLPLLLKGLVAEVKATPAVDVEEVNEAPAAAPAPVSSNPLQNYAELAITREQEKVKRAEQLAQRKQAWTEQFEQFETLRKNPHLQVDEIQGALQALCVHWEVNYPKDWDGESDLVTTWEGDSPVVKVPVKLPLEQVFDIGNGLHMPFCFIPAGSFEREGHTVTLTEDFWMGKFPVTQGQWTAVMGTNPSDFTKAGKNAPVETVSWEDTQEFLAKVAHGVNLPTEAQWEYACRAGTTGDYNVDGATLDTLGWYNKNSGKTTHPVGEKLPNAWGLHDMHGNVWEWCRDWHSEYSRKDEVDPEGPHSGSDRVLRGGSWLYSASNCRSAYRSRNRAGFRDGYFGFRVCLFPGPEK